MVAAVIISLFSVAVCSCAIFLSSLDWDLSHGTLEANLSVEWLALIWLLTCDHLVCFCNHSVRQKYDQFWHRKTNWFDFSLVIIPAWALPSVFLTTDPLDGSKVYLTTMMWTLDDHWEILRKINKNEITSAQCIAMMVLTIILKDDGMVLQCTMLMIIATKDDCVTKMTKMTRNWQFWSNSLAGMQRLPLDCKWPHFRGRWKEVQKAFLMSPCNWWSRCLYKWMLMTMMRMMVMMMVMMMLLMLMIASSSW